MASEHLQLPAFVLALSGACGVLAATLLPNWKVSVDGGASIISAVVRLQGLWMDCTWHSTGMLGCTLRLSVLSLPLHVQAARAAMVLACVLAALGVCVAPVGMKCTRFAAGREAAKRQAALAAGACFLAAGVAGIVPTVWYTREMVATFLDPTVPESGKPEPGGAVYTGFVSGALLLFSGGVFCGSYTGKQPKAWLPPSKRQLVDSAVGSAARDCRDYV